jgi:hypothetical protein
MKNYRIVKDSFLGFEAQVRYAWFPFLWFQMNDFYWINTWPSEEHARHFIAEKKAGRYGSRFHHEGELNQSEFEKEVKLLMFQSKNFNPEVIWSDAGKDNVRRNASGKRGWAFPAFNG